MTVFKYNIFILLAIFIISCQSEQNSTAVQYQKIAGKTMGTTYHITYKDSSNRNLKSQIDSFLVAINMEVSTYEKEATITQFNQSLADTFKLKSFPTSKNAIKVGSNAHFMENFLAAKMVYEKTAGAFDPTVMPLVNYWGFGYTPKKPVTRVDSVAIDSILQYVGFDKIELIHEDSVQLQKKQAQVQLDFSALAKGYGVDAIGILLERLNISDYLVEIGGEVRARGKNPKGEDWSIGINVPQEEASVTDNQTIVQLKDKSLATSGNYRNFYEINGVKYSHTINPKTGFPERNALLSASVLANECMMADAYATAFMVMGLEKAFELAMKTPEIEAYLIYSKEDGNMSVKKTQGF